MTEPIDTDAIRENLRLIGAAALPIYWRQSLEEMANEIDRLRADNRNLRESLHQYVVEDYYTDGWPKGGQDA